MCTLTCGGGKHKEKEFGHIDLATQCDQGLRMARLSKRNLWTQWWSTSNKTSVQRPENSFPSARKYVTTEEEYERLDTLWMSSRSENLLTGCALANMWIVTLLCSIKSYILDLKTHLWKHMRHFALCIHTVKKEFCYIESGEENHNYFKSWWLCCTVKLYCKAPDRSWCHTTISFSNVW